MDLRKTLKTWREKSIASNINFFAFTMVRNPISLIISRFNDHCLKRRSRCILKNEIIKSKKKLVQSFMGMNWVNIQTRYYLFGGKESNAFWETNDVDEKAKLPTKSQSDELFEEIKLYLDWVGTTECMSNDTLPKLEAFLPSSFDASHTPKKKIGIQTNDIVTKNMLNAKKINRLHNITYLDFTLYQRVIHYYGSSCIQN